LFYYELLENVELYAKDFKQLVDLLEHARLVLLNFILCQDLIHSPLGLLEG
jgi:hypothetical protein